RRPKEFVSKNSNAKIKSFSPSPIMEEIDFTFTPDDPMPPSIEEDDDDSRDILIREELLDNYPLPIPKNESFHFDIPLSSRPPAKPPDGNTGILNIKMMGDVSDQKVLDTCSALAHRVEGLENEKAAQQLEIVKLKARVVAASTHIPAAKPKILNITAAPAVSTRRRKGVSREEIEEEDEEIIKSINETPAQKAAKRRKLHEQAKEDEDLKKQLEVVDDEDDDVFIEATPIGKKVPVVDYEIVMINNKPRYKIIKADSTHQLYISFITLLKNFDR
nr:hypothetical protein [Tanacetum cinerariifolium]